MERPDYWVVRVSVAAMSKAELEKFMVRVTNSLCEPVAIEAKATCFYAKSRARSKGLPSEMRYVNIAGGTRHSAAVAAAWG